MFKGWPARWTAFCSKLERTRLPQRQLVATVWSDLEPEIAALVPDAGVTEDGRVLLEGRTEQHLLSLEIDRDDRVLWYFEDLVEETPEGNDDSQTWPDVVATVRNRLQVIAAA